MHPEDNAKVWHVAGMGVAALVVGAAISLALVKGCGPPTPVPPPTTAPAPADPFAATLAAAYAQDTEADRAVKLQALGIHFTKAAMMATDQKYQTAGDLDAAVQADGLVSVGDIATVLPKTRRAIGDELNTKLPGQPTTPLDAATRQQCVTQYSRMVQLIGGLK